MSTRTGVPARTAGIRRATLSAADRAGIDQPLGGEHAALLVTSALLVPTSIVFGLLAAAAAGVAASAESGGLRFLSDAELRPEPGEQLAYLVLLALPLALAAAVASFLRWGEKLRQVVGSALVPAAAAGQAAIVAVIVISLWHQRSIYVYFDLWQLLLALGVSLASFALLASSRAHGASPAWGSTIARKVARRAWLRRAPAGLRRLLWPVIAVLATAAYASTTVYRGDNIALAPVSTWVHLPYTFEEFAAVIGGRTPLVDFVPQYTAVLPYLAWPVLSLTGLSVAFVTGVMATFSAVCLLSVYVALRRVTASAGGALLLYLPFLSLSFFPAIRDGAQLHSIGTYYALLPLRYFFPLLLTGLVAALAPRTRRWWPALALGATAGAGVLNNAEFGIAALGGVVVAVFAAVLVTSDARHGRRDVLAAELRVLTGVGAAVVLFSVGTLMRSGSLPNLSESFYFSRQFAASGFYMLPLPGPVGLHLVIYATCALALVLALVAAIQRRPRPGARGPAGLALLAFSAVFALGAGAYYVGRSHPLVLVAVFCAWGLCIVALTAEVGGRLKGAFARPTPGQMVLALPAALVAGLFTLSVTTLAGADVLLGQAERLQKREAATIFAAKDMRDFVRACSTPGESVMLLHPLGHWVAADAGLRNYFPFNHPGSVVTQQQVSEVAAALRRHDVASVYVGRPPFPPGGAAMTAALQDLGYRVVAERPATVPVDQAAVAGGPMALWRQPTTVGPCT